MILVELHQGKTILKFFSALHPIGARKAQKTIILCLVKGSIKDF